MNSKFYKAEADRLLAVNNRKTEFVKIILVATLISLAASAIVAPLASFVITPMISLIMARTAYKIYCNKDISVNDIFSDFSKTLDVILYNLITIALVLLGMILFIIPGIIVGFRLSLGYLIMADEPDISFSDALKKSNEMMKGNCWAFFKLNFSFFGWYILVVLTFGILSFWVVPRVQTANMAFYARIKKERYGEDIPAAAEDSAPYETYSQPEYTPEEPATPAEEAPVAEEAPAEEAGEDGFAPPEYKGFTLEDINNDIKF